MRDEASGRATRIKVIAAFVAVYIVWGSTFLAIKVAVETIPPLTAAGIRFLFAGLILYSWARFRGAPKPTAAQWGNLGMLGAIMFLPVYAALFWAERTVPSGLSAVLVATLPIWTLLLETGLLKRRRATGLLAIAVIAGFSGVVVLSTGAGDGKTAIAWLPCVAIVVGEMFWAIGSVITTRVELPRSSAVTAGAEMLCGGTLLLLSGAAIGEWRAVHPPTVVAAIAMLYLIVAGSIVAFNAYVWLLGRTTATRLSSYSYVNPVVALVIGYQFAGEHLTPHAVSGSLLVLASVVLIQWATKRGTTGTPRVQSGEQTADAIPAVHATRNQTLPTQPSRLGISGGSPLAAEPPN
jgi:drug/metabolite transporter (DMT)-like permease